MSSLLFVLSLLVVPFLSEGVSRVLKYSITLYTTAIDDGTEWWLGQFVNMSTSCSPEDLTLEGGKGSPQAQAPVLFNPVIHHSDKPFVDF